MSAVGEAASALVQSSGRMQTLLVRVAIVATLGVCVTAAGAVLWHHYTSLVDAKAALSGQVAGLQGEVTREANRADELGVTVVKWAAATEVQSAALDKLAQIQVKSDIHQQELLNVLATHNLGALAKRKPGLVERRVNAGTDSAFRLLEHASESSGDSDDPGPTAPRANPPKAPAP